VAEAVNKSQVRIGGVGRGEIPSQRKPLYYEGKGVDGKYLEGGEANGRKGTPYALEVGMERVWREKGKSSVGDSMGPGRQRGLSRLGIGRIAKGKTLHWR